jgi:hypothetical protein
MSSASEKSSGSWHLKLPEPSNGVGVGDNVNDVDGTDKGNGGNEGEG